MKKENERLLHEFKSKERIYKFGLERFSSSSEDIKIYIGFNISEQVVSDIIITGANFLYLMLGSLPIWPSREQIKQYLPEVFKGEFENIQGIIDCTEIKCQTPQDLEKQSELYTE